MSTLVSQFMTPVPMLLCLLASSCVSLAVWRTSVCGAMGTMNNECTQFADYANPIASCLACIAVLFVFMAVSGGGVGAGGRL